MTQVRIAINGATARDGAIHLDGRDVSHLTRGLTLTAAVHEPTRLSLDVLVTKAAEFDGEAVVSLAPDVAELLVGLGWTPPAEMGA